MLPSRAGGPGKKSSKFLAKWNNISPRFPEIRGPISLPKGYLLGEIGRVFGRDGDNLTRNLVRELLLQIHL